MDNRQRIVYVNGQYVPESDAKISVFDRGFLMADAVYEVIAVIDGVLVDAKPHLQRLARSLGELNMPIPDVALLEVVQTLLQKNNLQEGVVYLQVTRGSAERDFLFDVNMTPNVVMFTQSMSVIDNPKVDQGLRVMTQYDIRWQRRDIKTTQLLAQSLAKMIAKHAGYDDAWMVDDLGYVTEGSSNNAAIICGNQMITRQANHDILNGITRHAMFKTLDRFDLTLVERKFTPDEAKAADAALMTSSGAMVLPVVSIDGCPIGDGKPSPLVLNLRQAYIETVRQAANG